VSQRGQRAAEEATETRREMAMAGKSGIERDGRKVLAVKDGVERGGKPLGKT
jgi:hypothetical protein